MRMSRLEMLVLLLLAGGAARAQEKISLDEAVRRALIRNPTAEVARQEILRAEGIVHEARAPSLPTLFGSGVYTRLDSDRTLASSDPATPPRVIAGKNSIALNATLTVPLVAPARWAQWLHASENVDVARASSEDVRRTVAVATARAYLSVVAQHRLVQVNTQARDAAKAHLDDAHARFEVGSGNRLDEVRAGQELATDAAQVAASEAALVRSREALGVLVGEEGPVEVQDQIQLPAPPVPEEALRELATKRQDLVAQEQRAEAAKHVLNDSWTDYLPLLSGVFQPFYQNPASLTQPETGWQAQLVLSIPFYDGGARYGLRRERSALYNEAKANLDGLLRQARSDVRTGFEAVRRADESLGAARESAKLAHEALDLTNLAYKEGATNDLEVVDAQRRSRDADTAALVAEDTARQARIDLLAASGRFP